MKKMIGWKRNGDEEKAKKYYQSWSRSTCTRPLPTSAAPEARSARSTPPLTAQLEEPACGRRLGDQSHHCRHCCRQYRRPPTPSRHCWWKDRVCTKERIGCLRDGWVNCMRDMGDE
eukprot:5402613-Pleurochrysis_carterae.AAC.2